MPSCHDALRLRLVVLCAALFISGCTNPSPSAAPPGKLTPSGVPEDPSHAAACYTYNVVNIYPHDDGAFTQGLAYDDGVLYEGTGRRGQSSLRKVDLETGMVRERESLGDEYFGEGVAVVDNRLVQLTWKSGVGFVYAKNDLSRIGEFSYDTEGWGLTYGDARLIMSDGTNTLYFLDANTYALLGQVEVFDDGVPVMQLNELEYINGLVFANVWKADRIAMIDPGAGRVVGWLDLMGLLESQQAAPGADVLNGIAYDSENDRLFVTGKLWPWLFEIQMVAVVP